MIKKFTATVALLVMVLLLLSITAYAAFPPVVAASWRSEFKKVEIVEDEPDAPDEVVDFTGDVSLDEQDLVVPDTTAYDGEPSASDGGVFVIVAVEEPEEPGEPDEPEDQEEDQTETQMEEPITTPDEADENI